MFPQFLKATANYFRNLTYPRVNQSLLSNINFIENISFYFPGHKFLFHLQTHPLTPLSTLTDIVRIHYPLTVA